MAEDAFTTLRGKIDDRVMSVTLDHPPVNLMDRSIPHEVTERRVKMSVERVLAYPAVRFTIDDQPIDATVFPADGFRQAPVSPVDGKPMRRANVGEVEALIEDSPAL